MYRVTLHNGPTGNDRCFKYDTVADSTDEALRRALKAFKLKHGYDAHVDFSDSTIEEHPVGASVIGIRFAYKEGNGKGGHQYLFIKAETEKKAAEYYNSNIRGKNFYQPWPHKINDQGNCTYDSIADTYFAACNGYDFDATC